MHRLLYCVYSSLLCWILGFTGAVKLSDHGWNKREGVEGADVLHLPIEGGAEDWKVKGKALRD